MLAHQSSPRVGCPGQEFCPPLSPDQIRRLCRSAGFFAGGVAQSLGLPREDQNDLRQEIALQVLSRLRFFDERRAPFGAFVDLIARRAAARLKASTALRRAQETLVNLQSRVPADSVDDAADDEDDGTTAFYAEDPRFALADFRHDLRAALDGAPARVADTVAAFGDDPDHAQPVSRTTWFRRRVELRRWLLAHGLAPPR